MIWSEVEERIFGKPSRILTARHRGYELRVIKHPGFYSWLVRKSLESQYITSRERT